MDVKYSELKSLLSKDELEDIAKDYGVIDDNHIVCRCESYIKAASYRNGVMSLEFGLPEVTLIK